MASFIRKFVNGAKEVEQMFETSASLGVDLIEVIWTKTARKSLAIIAGFYVPVIGAYDNNNATLTAQSWVEGSLKFHLDERMNCWGYIYDTPENRNLLYSSLSNGWFKIVDKRIREEIEKEADAKGYKNTVTLKSEVNVKKSFKELESEKRTKALEDKIAKMQADQEMLIKELEFAKNEKQVHVDKRVKGTPVVKEDPKVD